ncbi:MAG: hypothetical protein H5T97_06980 [Firmicutes bacterium]|nr:hypothetical protein [Bacillota bacterium]
MDKKSELLELLRCALANCDNIMRLGPVGVEIVKLQINQAIDLVEDRQPQEERGDGRAV